MAKWLRSACPSRFCTLNFSCSIDTAEKLCHCAFMSLFRSLSSALIFCDVARRMHSVSLRLRGLIIGWLERNLT